MLCSMCSPSQPASQLWTCAQCYEQMCRHISLTDHKMAAHGSYTACAAQSSAARLGVPDDAVCACCDEPAEGYTERHPFDPHARDLWRYRGSGNWNCTFCYDVCRSLDQHGAGMGHISPIQAE